MRYSNGPTQSEYLDARRRAIRSFNEKRAFRRHLAAFFVLNLAFWLSWVIGGLREEWLAPWPLVPTMGWGLFILYRVYRLGGTQAIRRDTIDREAERLRRSVRPSSEDQLATRPITFSTSIASRPIRPFRLREIIDARERSAAEVIDLRDHQDERAIDLHEPRGERASIRSAVTMVEIDDIAES